MYARTITVRGDRRAVDDGVAYVREEVLPTLDRIGGCVGLSMLADRDSGLVIVTTAWESEQALYAGGPRLRPLRERLAELLGGQLEVQPWEIAVLHRVRQTPRGAWTRVTRGRAVPSRVAAVLDGYRSDLLRRIEAIPGFCSASLLIERGEGRGAAAVTYSGRADLDRSRDEAASLREEFARTAGLEILDVAELELVLAHLQAPETG